MLYIWNEYNVLCQLDLNLKKNPYGGTENLSIWLKATESHELWLNWDLNQGPYAQNA